MNHTNHTSSIESSFITAAGTWRFPHSTCEATQLDGLVLQPYSCLVNAITTIFVVAVMAFPKQFSGWTVSKNDLANSIGKNHVSKVARLSLIPLAMFEAFHTFSHSVHWDKGSVLLGDHNVQEAIQHVLCAWGMSAGAFALCSHKYGHTKYQHWISLFFIADVINWFGFGGSLKVVFGIGVVISVMMSYYHLVGPLLQKRIIFVSINAFLATLLVVIESLCCQWWVTKISPNFPYHVIVELYGLYLVIYFSDTMYLLDTHDSKVKTN